MFLWVNFTKWDGGTTVYSRWERVKIKSRWTPFIFISYVKEKWGFLKFFLSVSARCYVMAFTYILIFDYFNWLAISAFPATFIMFLICMTVFYFGPLIMQNYLNFILFIHYGNWRSK